MNLQIVGLLYDAAGIFVLGVYAFRSAAGQIAAQSASKWDFNLALAEMLAYSRVDAGAGAILLLMGFLLQAAYLLFASEIPTLVTWGFLILLFLILGLYLGCLRSHLSTGIVAKVTEIHEDNIASTASSEATAYNKD